MTYPIPEPHIVEQEDWDVEAQIDSTERAEAHLRKVAYWEAEAAEVRAHAATEHARVNDWETRQLEKIRRPLSWHSAGLKAFLFNSGKKTLSLVYGKLRRTKGRERIEIEDPEAFVKAQMGDDFVTTTVKKTPDKKAILAHIHDTGEIPEGSELVTGDDSFKIEVT